MSVDSRSVKLLTASTVGAVALLFVACGGGGAGARPGVEVAPEVTAETRVAVGTLETFAGSTRGSTHYEPFVKVSLTVPDGSNVLQFTRPLADIAVHSAGAVQTVEGVKCSLSVGDGRRDFTFTQDLTGQQQKSLQKVVVKRVYQ